MGLEIIYNNFQVILVVIWLPSSIMLIPRPLNSLVWLQNRVGANYGCGSGQCTCSKPVHTAGDLIIVFALLSYCIDNHGYKAHLFTWICRVYSLIALNNLSYTKKASVNHCLLTLELTYGNLHSAHNLHIFEKITTSVIIILEIYILYHCFAKKTLCNKK